MALGVKISSIITATYYAFTVFLLIMEFKSSVIWPIAALRLFMGPTSVAYMPKQSCTCVHQCQMG
jgi:hypothetical protein